MLTGQNGILNRAGEAKEKTDTANKDEQRKLAQAEALMSTEKTTYKGVTLPEGFAPTKIEGEDSISEGLVITDGYGNEYVWVEVPKADEVYQTAGLSITAFTDEEYGKIFFLAVLVEMDWFPCDCFVTFTYCLFGNTAGTKCCFYRWTENSGRIDLCSVAFGFAYSFFLKGKE